MTRLESQLSGSSAGFVLAGGRSSRMGSDKALVLFHGVPLIQIAMQILIAAGLPARVAGVRASLAAFAEQVPEQIPDTFPDAGPLAGVHAALTASASEWNVFLPVDLPLMPASLLVCLLLRAALTGTPVTATRLNGRIEPFPVVLNRTALPGIVQLLHSGQTACHTAWQSIPVALGAKLDAVSVEHLTQCGQCRHPQGLPPFLWFQSANTPADLTRLHRISIQNAEHPQPPNPVS